MSLLDGKVALVTGAGAGIGRVADAVAYLCSDRASFVTGEVLAVDGGIQVNAHDA